MLYRGYQASHKVDARSADELRPTLKPHCREAEAAAAAAEAERQRAEEEQYTCRRIVVTCEIPTTHASVHR